MGVVSGGGGGAAFNGGTITQPLTIDNADPNGPTLFAALGLPDGGSGRAGGSLTGAGQATVRAVSGRGFTVAAAVDDAVHNFNLIDGNESGLIVNLSDTFSTAFEVRSRGSASRRLLLGGYNASDEIIVGFFTGSVGFYGTAGVPLQTGVAVSAAGIHAALVNLGLITA